MKKRKTKTQPAEETFVAALIPTESHIVTRDGRPCTVINVSGVHKGGVLVPGSPVALFARPRDAKRAIDRTVAARTTLDRSLIRDWPRLRPFLGGGKFESMPAGHQVEPAALLAPKAIESREIVPA